MPSKKMFTIVVIVISFVCSFGGRILLRGEIPTMPTGFASLPGHAVPAHEQVGDWLLHNTHGPITVAVGEAGLIGYMNPQMQLLDLNGLMDKHIAGLRKAGKPYDTDYIFSRHPDYIILYGTDSSHLSAAPNSGSYLDAIMSSARFHSDYSSVHKYAVFDIFMRNVFR